MATILVIGIQWSIMRNYNLVSELICLVAAIYFWQWLKKTYWIAFIPFLAFTILIETFASFVWPENNGWLYNLYVSVQLTFSGFFFYRMNPGNQYKKAVLLVLVAFHIISLLRFTLYDSFLIFNLLLFTLDSVITVLLGFWFLLYVISENDRSALTRIQPALWITVGMIAYFSVCGILFNVTKFIRFNELKILGIYIDNFVSQLLSIFMYSCFAYSFYLCKKIRMKF